MVSDFPGGLMQTERGDWASGATWGNRVTGERHTCAHYFWQDIEAPFVVDIPEARIRVYLSDPAAIGMIEVGVDDDNVYEDTE